jgi:hypothetical protein
VHGHLVAVEVGVEGGADQRVELDRLALDQHRLEGLDAEAVQRRRAVRAAPGARGSPPRGCPRPRAAPSRPCAWRP